MRSFASMQNLDLWNARLDIVARWGNEVGTKTIKQFQKSTEKAKSKDRLKAESKLTTIVDGEPRFISDPPLMVPVEELYADSERDQLENTIRQALRRYSRTLQDDHRYLFDSYRFVHLARKVWSGSAASARVAGWR
jgi:hypothetical protein